MFNAPSNSYIKLKLTRSKIKRQYLTQRLNSYT